VFLLGKPLVLRTPTIARKKSTRWQRQFRATVGATRGCSYSMYQEHGPKVETLVHPAEVVESVTEPRQDGSWQRVYASS